MFKRWSIKSLTGETSIEPKTKQETSITEEPLDQPSLDNTLKDPNTNGAMQETVLDPQERIEKVAEGDAVPTQLPARLDSADDTAAAPVSSSETSSVDISGSAPLGVSVSSEITTPPYMRRTEPAESPFPSLRPSPVISGDAPSHTPGNTVNTPAFTNTLSVPGFESPTISRGRRLSFRSLAFFYGRDTQLPSAPNSQTQVRSKFIIQTQSKPSRTEKEALASAIALRTLMIGPSSLPLPAETSVIRTRKSLFSFSSYTVSLPSPTLKKVKAQLLKFESANAIIANLRRLPLPDGPSFHAPGRASPDSFVTHTDAGGAPIHAVCLDCTDEEAEKKHFSRLQAGHGVSPPSSLKPDVQATSPSPSFPNIATASLESLIPVLRDLHLVSLLTSPDLGFGQAVGDGEDVGVLTGSVPSPATLVEGFEEITTQLMNLGFATSKAVAPSHAGIYPPEDRISVLTYWWGLELVLPEPSVQYLSKAKSISSALLNFLSALALFNNGVREALPFIRYIANFVDFEWSAIKSQDKGQGVVCAATWVMPAAMVPRPWDFASRPKTSPGSPNDSTSPSASKTTPGTDNKGTDGANPPTQPDSLYPVAPALPLMPQLLVTPATLPRDIPVPEQVGI